MEVYGNAIVPHRQGNSQHSQAFRKRESQVDGQAVPAQLSCAGMAQSRPIWRLHSSKLVSVAISTAVRYCQLMGFVALEFWAQDFSSDNKGAKKGKGWYSSGPAKDVAFL